jgi:hypothetical protein
MIKGFIYVAVSPLTSPSPFKFNENKKRLNVEFMHSFNSLRKHHPNLPVTLFTDYEDLLGLNLTKCNIEKIDNDWGFLPKVKGIHSSPYDKFIFLDCDTQINKPVHDLFNLLNEFDIVAATEYEKEIINTGVLGINKTTISGSNFLDLWLEKMKNKKSYAMRKSLDGNVPNKIPDDQAEFNELLRIRLRDPINKTMKRIQENLEFLEFKKIPSSIYNCRNKEFTDLTEDQSGLTKIFHMRGLV